MKRILLAAVAISLSLNCLAWGRLGHCTIQEIAWRHLTPSAKANIQKYVGDTIPAEYSFWMDKVVRVEPYATEFAGWHASIATEDCKSPLYIRAHRRHCRDGVTAAYVLRDYLSDYRELPDSCVVMGIKCLIHVIGDFHCPAHVRYTDDSNEGKFYLEFNGDRARLHDVWDSGLIQTVSGLNWLDYKAYAERLDTWNKRQIKSAQKGYAREWFEDAARDIRPVVGTAVAGDVLGKEWMEARYPLAEMEIRKAGYRLAAALNEIFE